MARIRQLTFNVPVVGVGRKDYSQQIEYSVEPIIRSYQESYVHDEVYVVDATSTRVIDVAIASETVVLLYDFLASQVDAADILGLQVQAIDTTGQVSTIFSKYGLQQVTHHHTRGAPVFRAIRVTLTNPTGAQMLVYVTIAGIRTGIEEYYQRVA